MGGDQYYEDSVQHKEDIRKILVINPGFMKFSTE